MSHEIEIFLILVAFAGLVVLAIAWNGSRAQQRNLFGAKEVEPAGEFSGLSVFRLHCGEDGPKVGVHFPFPGEAGLRVVLDPDEALRLADLLERSAEGARAS
jgi:hypothetical protein